MKAQLTIEFLLSFLMVIVMVGLLSTALNEYYNGVKFERDITTKRMALEQGAFSEAIMDAGLSNYKRTTDRGRIYGQENIYRENGISTGGAYRNKIYNEITENEYPDETGAKIPFTTN